MRDDTLDSLKFFAVVAIVIAAILAVGWRQPLRYRFMSRADIEALENPPTPEPATPSTPWIYDSSRPTSLDRPAYQRGSDGQRRTGR